MDTSFSYLIEEITEQCKGKDINVAHDFTNFLVSLVSLGLANHPGSGELASRSELGDAEAEDEGEGEARPSLEVRILEGVIEKLLDQSRPNCVTLKIQFEFAKRYRDRGYIVKRCRARLAQKTAPLVSEICETTELDSSRDIDILYQKMLVVMTLLSGLGDPTVPAVLREVAIGLHSVLQPSELPRYVSLSWSEKEEQLAELALIVAGIRLFNRDCQRGGEGIDDLPCILKHGMASTRSEIIDSLETLMENVYALTAAAAYVVRNNIYDDEHNDEAAVNDATWFVEMLAASRQQEIYVRRLLADLELCEDETKCLTNNLQSTLLKLHETVKFRTAVPTNKVYPLFKDIASTWLRLQNEIIVLSNINDMLRKLKDTFPKKVKPHYLKALRKIIRKGKIMTDAERLEKTMGQAIVDYGECLVYYPNCDTDFDKLNLQFLGFCAYSFVVGQGALIPGNPNIGVLEWRGKCYVFSSVYAAQQFGQKPDSFVTQALKIIRTKQEYVHLFQMYNDLQIKRYQESSSDEYVLLPLRQHQEIQTDTHLVPAFIDLEYSSSLWKLRENALHLATICRCVTRSTQTFKSHFRMGINLQTLMPKDKDCQTGKDRGTNTKTVKKYQYGTRGKANSERVECCCGDGFQIFNEPKN